MHRTAKQECLIPERPSTAYMTSTSKNVQSQSHYLFLQKKTRPKSHSTQSLCILQMLCCDWSKL